MTHSLAAQVCIKTPGQINGQAFTIDKCTVSRQHSDTQPPHLSRLTVAYAASSHPCARAYCINHLSQGCDIYVVDRCAQVTIDECR